MCTYICIYIYNIIERERREVTMSVNREPHPEKNTHGTTLLQATN